MEYDVTTKHFELPEDLRGRIKKSMGKLDRYADRIIGAHMFLELDGSRYKVELQLKTRSSLFNARETSYDLYSSVDKTVKKIERQLRRYIDKLHGKKTVKRKGE